MDNINKEERSVEKDSKKALAPGYKISHQILEVLKDFSPQEKELLKEIKTTSQESILAYEQRLLRIKDQIKQKTYKINKEKIIEGLLNEAKQEYLLSKLDDEKNRLRVNKGSKNI